ncbi:tyrosine-protein phosphatase [Formosa sp. A9]|uniref:tyrosine-protein phosphatase n=1 Tax=Formosa sp. A9 TaxID=3442641 RepID=UPI003EB7A873
MTFNLHKTISLIAAAILANSCADYEKAEQPVYTLNETILVNRLDNNNYQLILNSKGNWSIYKGANANAIQWNEVASLNEANNTAEIKNESPTKRLFFAAVNGADTLYLSEREINLEKAYNFRDMGGIKTADGKQTKWGMLFRSGEIAELSEADLAYMKTLNIKTILDLRSDQEIEDKPDTYPSQVNWKHLPIGDMGKNGKMEEMMKVLKEADPETFDSSKLMEEASIQFVGSTEQFKKMFADLLNEDEVQTPLLFHCTAGKDRTGFSSAFILRALGVDQETIINEYLLSNYFRFEHNEDMVKKAARYYGMDQRILRPLMGVKAEWLKKGFNEIDTQYGSFDNYLMAIGVDSTAKAKLKTKFLY